MDIVVLGSMRVSDEQHEKQVERPPLPERPIANRRKNQVDRRQSVRDGITVTLSSRVERRKQPDRRRMIPDS
ncbi:hypothetical protein LJC22_03780 [Desulfosarcina sp. OttesenSCG-928-G10]|nr:hypothetical protein [Desulfosarcina sp. OttesenSCG-928-G10]MDL2321294.1 hypothetical protein [Desulfosarcina sp. OttesenSCG-928-B08]